jgi:NAD(P)-dependent dehydrogenase (short-subunit alcohol dehydrogenase family)
MILIVNIDFRWRLRKIIMRRKKVALVTGGAAGIGHAICKWLMEKNYHVATIDSDDLPKDMADSSILYTKGDASDEGQAIDLCALSELPRTKARGFRY